MAMLNNQRVIVESDIKKTGRWLWHLGTAPQAGRHLGLAIGRKTSGHR